MPNSPLETAPTSVTEKALYSNFSLDEKNRKEEILINKDFYYGKQGKYVSLIHDDEEALYINLTRPIVKKRSTLLYQKPLVRTFEGPEASISLLEEVYTQNNIDQLLQSTDLAAELSGSGLIFVSKEGDPPQIKLYLYDASDVSVIASENNPETLQSISIVKEVERLLKNGDGSYEVQRILVSQIWTDTTVVKYEDKQLISSERNELGFIPFVNFKAEEVYSQYLGHAPTTSYRKLNASFNNMLSMLGFIIKFQAAEPIILSGFPGGEGITIHPGRAINLPAGATASNLVLKPKIEATLDTLKYMETKLFETSSVPKISIVGGEGVSGRELLVRWHPLLQVFTEKSIRFSKYELDLANTILKVAGLEPVTSVLVDYPDEDVLPLSAAEETLERDIRLNLTTAIDEVLRRNPNMSEADAEAIVLSNKEFNIQNLTAADSGSK